MFKRYALAAAGGGSLVFVLVYAARKLYDRYVRTQEGVVE
jgi:hypothetical protein